LCRNLYTGGGQFRPQEKDIQMNNIVNLSPWAARATEVTADPVLARFLAPIERRKLFDAAGNEAAHVGLYNDTKCVGVVSPTYHVLQNATAHDVVTDAIRGSGYHGKLDVKSVQGGRFGGRWGTRYILADHGFAIQQPGKYLATRVELELFLRTSYDGSTGTSIGVSMFDRFCDNGMVFHSQVQAFRAKHTRYAEDNLFRVTPAASRGRALRGSRASRDYPAMGRNPHHRKASPRIAQGSQGQGA
jgi:hypothetical protein